MAREKKFDNGIKTVANNLLAANITMEIIIQSTGLTPTEIENLSDEDFDDE